MIEPIFFATTTAFRDWLAEHHADAEELWVGFWKVGSGHPSLTWPQSVDEALCFGWIDGVRRSIDAHRYRIRFTPRSATSKWSQVNLKRARVLKAEGRMAPAGLAQFSRAVAGALPSYAKERKTGLALSSGQLERFKRSARAWAYFSTQAPWYRRAAIHWVTSAKQAETQERRLDELIRSSREKEPVKPLARKARG